HPVATAPGSVLCAASTKPLAVVAWVGPGPFLLTFTGHCPYNDPRAPSDAAPRAGQVKKGRPPMKAVAVTPGKNNSARLLDVPSPAPSDREVLVKVLRVGQCGTDTEIAEGLMGVAPPGEEFLILGHEGLGVVTAVGSAVREFQPGDYVVATVR